MARIKYTPIEVEHMSDKEARHVYSRLRKLAHQRADRLVRAGYGEYDVAAYYPTLKNEPDPRAGLLDISLHLRDPRTLVRGLKAYNKKMIATLHKHGYTFVNESNLKRYGDFMEWVRDNSIDSIHYNPKVIDLFIESERLGVSQEVLEAKFEKYLNDEVALSKLVSSMQKLDIKDGRTRVNAPTILNKMNKK